MIPVDQTGTGRLEGNCMEACVASILEVGIEDVPVLHAAGDRWREVLGDFLARFDLEQIDIAVAQSGEAGYTPTGFHIIVGPGPRGLEHAVVGLGGKMVHDPHPDRKGLVEEEEWTLFVKRFLGGEKHGYNV